MKKIWNTIINGMDQVWDKTIEFLGKLNSWIPLSTVLIAGIGLLSVVLILAICGCVLRKRLVPHWLIWTYFAFATIIIFAHTGNNLAAIVAAIEIPVLVVLLSYILLLLFRRRPRYVYVEKEIYARQLAKGRVYQVSTDGQVIEKQDKPVKKNQSQEQSAREIETETENKIEAEKEESNVEAEIEAEEIDEMIEHESEMKAAEAAKLAAAEEAARVAREAEKAAERKAAEQAARETFSLPAKEEPVKRVDKSDFLTARTVRPNLTSSTATTTIDLPTVNPIPDKSYEPMREPTIVTKPISQTIPGLKVTGSSNTSRFGTATRPTITTTARPTTFTTTRSTNSTPNTNKTNLFTSMYNPRIVKTTTTTTNTSENRIDAVSTSRTVNGNTTSATAIKASSTGTSPRSTEDIMAAIERLRNSMKK